MAEALSDQLTRVQSAIAAIENGGQDITYNGRRVTMADVQTLYKRESDLIRRISRQSRGGGLRVRRATPIA